MTPLTHSPACSHSNDQFFGAVFNRALACLASGKLEAARADYKTCSSLSPMRSRSPTAWRNCLRQHETNEAIRNYKLYLANANTNTAEAYKRHINRLRELKGPSP